MHTFTSRKRLKIALIDSDLLQRDVARAAVLGVAADECVEVEPR